MNLLLLATILFLFSLPTAVTAPGRHCRSLFAITKTLSAPASTLSPITKKPAYLAGFRYLGLSLTRLTAPFSSCSPSRTFAALSS